MGRALALIKTLVDNIKILSRWMVSETFAFASFRLISRKGQLFFSQVLCLLNGCAAGAVSGGPRFPLDGLGRTTQVGNT
jgi:hypothetical protein